ncbi:MAG: hypothetical protein GXP49_07480 [Deltaproteobacteria bacterium]|nr:hypothetical protein [Deltaproteobacteria bacterium]
MKQLVSKIAAISLAMSVTGGCSPGCDYRQYAGKPSKGAEKGVVTLLTKSGLDNRTKTILDRIDMTFEAIVEPGTIDVDGKIYYKYSRAVANMQPESLSADFSQEDGTVEFILQFKPVRFTLIVTQYDSGALVSVCKDVEVNVQDVSSLVDLDPTGGANGPSFIVADANGGIGQVSVNLGNDCGFEHADILKQELTKVFSRACIDAVKEFPPRLTQLGDTYLGLDISPYSYFKIDSSIPPVGKPALEMGASLGESNLEVTSKGLVLEAPLWLKGTPGPIPADSPPSFPDLDPEGDSYDYAIAFRKSVIEQLFDSAFNSGLLDIDLYSTSLLNGPTTNDLEKWFPGLEELAPKAPLLLRLRPKLEPSLYFTGESLMIDLSGLSADLYFLMDDAFVRLSGGSMSMKLTLKFIQGEDGPAASMECSGFVHDSPLFNEMFSEKTSQKNAEKGLEYLISRLISRNMETVLPWILASPSEMLYKSFEVRGSEEPYLYMYFDLKDSAGS